jgi:hypothetical protein
MNPIPLGFAMLGGRGIRATVRSLVTSNSSFFQQTLLCLAVLAVIFVVFAWAALIRKRSHSGRHLTHSPPRSRAPEPAPHTPAKDGHGGGFSWRMRHKRRHRRRGEPPRNPTLAETGGLPPLRDKRAETHASENI